MRNPSSLTWCIRILSGSLLAVLLSACGGSSGGPGGGCTVLDPTRDPALPGCGSSAGSGSGGTSVTGAKLALSLRDAGGAATTSVSPENSANMVAIVTDSKGAPQANVAVTFTTNDKSAVLIPASGTALTDASGKASVGLQAGTQAGAYTATAAASVGTATVSSSASYAVTFKPLTLSSLTISPATLSAGGNASISVTVLSGGATYTPPLSVSFTSPCVSAGKASIGSPVLTQSGVATASYTDKGCGVADIVTASVTLGSSATTKTGTINVLPASAGSIKFISAQTTNIALKGTGGFGRPEFSTVTFQVFDTTGAPVSGKQIDFMFASAVIGGLTLSPTSATSAADGTVTTLVTAGTIPTSVRIVASVQGTAITTLSNILVISTGVPDQRHFSLSSSTGNCEGRDIDQTCTFITAALGDHFGNPVPDGTAVNFTVESGIIGASCVTGSLPPPGATPDDVVPGVPPNHSQTTNSLIGPGSGTCTVELRSGAPRYGDGWGTVLAYALGEENLFDANGNNVYDSGDTFTDMRLDVFRDDDENGAWSPGEPCIGPNTNGQCSTPGDGVYNGVLRSPPQPLTQPTLYVSAQLGQIFSGSNAVITFSPAAAVCNANRTADILVTVKDVVGNIMPANTQLSFGALFGIDTAAIQPSSIKVPKVTRAVGQTIIPPSYLITVGCPSVSSTGKMTVTVTTPAGVTTTANVSIN